MPLIVALSLILVATGCIAQNPPTPAYPAGSLVVIGRQGGTVGLWLMYEEDCSVDIVYNWVEGGTEARLTGRVCRDGNTLYYKVSLAPEVRAEAGIQGDNLWVSEGEITPLP